MKIKCPHCEIEFGLNVKTCRLEDSYDHPDVIAAREKGYRDGILADAGDGPKWFQPPDRLPGESISEAMKRCGTTLYMTRAETARAYLETLTAR